MHVEVDTRCCISIVSVRKGKLGNERPNRQVGTKRCGGIVGAFGLEPLR